MLTSLGLGQHQKEVSHAQKKRIPECIDSGGRFPLALDP